MKFTLHSHHTSSLLLSNEVGSTPWPDNIWDTYVRSESFLQWIQQSYDTEEATVKDVLKDLQDKNIGAWQLVEFQAEKCQDAESSAERGSSA